MRDSLLSVLDLTIQEHEKYVIQRESRVLPAQVYSGKERIKKNNRYFFFIGALHFNRRLQD